MGGRGGGNGDDHWERVRASVQPASERASEHQHEQACQAASQAAREGPTGRSGSRLPACQPPESARQCRIAIGAERTPALERERAKHDGSNSNHRR
jgi:hypothetical protein